MGIDKLIGRQNNFEINLILTLASFGYYEKYMHVTKLLNTVVTYAKVWSAVKACTNKIEKWATHKTRGKI